MTSGDRRQSGFPPHISRIGTLMLKPGSATREVVLSHAESSATGGKRAQTQWYRAQFTADSASLPL